MKFKNKHEESHKENSNVHAGHRNRLRFRLSQTHFDKCDDYQVMEYVLYMCVHRKDTNEFGHQLINVFGSFANVCDANIEDLKKEGCTDTIAHFLSSIPYMFRNYQLSKQRPKQTLTCAKDIFNYLGEAVSFLPSEEFYVICLDGGDHVISRKLIAIGNNSQVNVKIKEIIHYAISMNARKLVFVHNHPTTSEEPSIEDLETTRKIYFAASMSGIEVSDHLIVNYENKYFSFANSGLIKQYEDECQQMLKKTFG